MSLRDLCNSPSGAGGGLERNPAQSLLQSALDWKFQTILYLLICRLLQHNISVWNCIKAAQTHSHCCFYTVQIFARFGAITREAWIFPINVVTAEGEKKKGGKRGLMFYIHFGKRLERCWARSTFGKMKESLWVETLAFRSLLHTAIITYRP